MSLRPFKFEVDDTGLNPNNLVPAESHTLQGTGKRFLVTDHGPFYTNSLILIDLATGIPLAPRTQYTAIQLEEDATLASGKEVCSIIIIDDPKVSSRVAVTYQAYGGWMSYSVTAILEMIQALDLDNRVIRWADIVGKPDRYPPAPHAHPLSDIYGWHKLFPSLNAIRDAILTGDQAVFEQIRTQFAAEIARLEGLNNGLNTRLNAHINNFNNPHQLKIHDIDGLTSAEIMALLAGKMDKGATADNSLKLEGRTFIQVRDQTIAAIQNPDLTRGLFNKNNLGENWVASDGALILTQSGWKKLKVHEATYGRTITEMGGYTTSETIALLNQRLPVGGTAVNSNALAGNSLSSVLSQAYAQVGSMGKRNVFISTADPSNAQGAVGDIWLKYE